MRPPKVEKLERRGDARALLGALEYRDEATERDGRVVDRGASVRVQAVDALGRIDSPEASEGITRALGDPAQPVRLAAIAALRQRGGQGAVEPLAAAVANWTAPELADVRSTALEALAGMRDSQVPLRVAAALLARTEDLDERDREILPRLAKMAEGGAGTELTISFLLSVLGEDARGERAIQMLAWFAPSSVPALIDALRDHRKREHAALALGRIHDSEAVDPLCALMLECPDPSIRRVAAWALGQIRDPSAVEALLLATGDPDYSVRAEAGAGFDEFGNAGVALAMTALLRASIDGGEETGAGEVMDAGEPLAVTEGREAETAAGTVVSDAEEAPQPVAAGPGPDPERGTETKVRQRAAVTQEGPAPSTTATALRRLLKWRDEQ